MKSLIRFSSILVVSCGGATASPAAAPAEPGTQCIQDAASTVSVPRTAPPRIEVRHILVRHTELNDPKGATRTKAAACLHALAALESLRSGSLDWPQAVERFSDSKDDDLGRVSPDELHPAFAGAAFSLEIDQLSYVTETDRGYHVIWRER